MPKWGALVQTRFKSHQVRKHSGVAELPRAIVVTVGSKGKRLGQLGEPTESQGN